MLKDRNLIRVAVSACNKRLFHRDTQEKLSVELCVFLSVTPCNKRLFHRETQRKDGVTQRKEHLRPDFVGIT